MTINFGKYAGCELQDIIQADLGYLIWVAANFKGNNRTAQQIEEIKKGSPCTTTSITKSMQTTSHSGCEHAQSSLHEACIAAWCDHEPMDSKHH